MSDRTIYIRSRPQAFSVVVKPLVSGLNNLLIESHSAAVEYADQLHAKHDWPIVDESDPKAKVVFRGETKSQFDE